MGRPTPSHRCHVDQIHGASFTSSLTATGSHLPRQKHTKPSESRKVPCYNTPISAAVPPPKQRASDLDCTQYFDFLKHNAIRLYHSTSYHSTVLQITGAHNIAHSHTAVGARAFARYT